MNSEMEARIRKAVEDEYASSFQYWAPETWAAFMGGCIVKAIRVYEEEKQSRGAERGS